MNIGDISVTLSADIGDTLDAFQTFKQRMDEAASSTSDLKSATADLANGLTSLEGSSKDVVSALQQTGSAAEDTSAGITKLGDAIQSAIVAPDVSAVIGAFTAIDESAAETGADVRSALAVELQAPDTAPFLDAMSGIEASAQTTGAEVVQDLSAPIPALDTAAAIGSLTALADSADSAGEAVKADFADMTIPPLDSTQAVASIEAIPEAAKEANAETTTDLAITVPALDVSVAVESINAIADAAALAGAETSTDLAIEVPPLDTTAAVGSIDLITQAAQEAGVKVVEDLSMPIPAPDTSAFIGGLQSLENEADKANATLSTLAQQANASVNAEWIEKATADLVALGGEADVVRTQLSTMLESGASAGEAFIAALTSIQQATGDVATGLAAVGNAAEQAGQQESGAADGARRFSDAAQAIVDAQKAADTALVEAQAVLSELQSAYASGAASEQALARAADDLQSAFAKANPQIEEAGTAAKDAGEKAQVASTDFGGLATEILKLAGITVSIEALVELGKAAVEASDHLDDATYAISKFTGSTESAQGVIEGLKEVAQDEGLSFPRLVTAAQRLEALLPPGTDVVELMTKLGNSSELTGVSVEALGRKFASMVESQTISAKALGDFGIRIEDVRDQMEKMGASAEVMDEGLKKALKTMDATQIVDLLEGSLEKLDGTAKQMNDDIGGDLKRAMNDWYIAIAKLGDAIGPLAREVLPELVAAMKGIVVGGDFVVTGIKLVTDAVLGMSNTIMAATFGIGQAIAKITAGDFSGAVAAVKSSTADIEAAVKSMTAEMAADVKSGTDFMTKAWSVDVPAAMDKTKKAAKDTSDELAGLSTKGKSAAKDIADAFNQIGSLEAKIGSGAGATALQTSFENASKAINTVAKVDLVAAIKAVDDYTQAQIRNGAGAGVMLQAFQEESKLISQLAKVDLVDAVKAMDNLVGSLSKAKEPLGIIQAAFEQEEKMIQQLAKQDLAAASAAWDKLIQTLQNTNAPLSVLNQALKDHSKFLEDNAAAADKAVIALDKAATSYSNFNTHGSAANQTMKEAADALDRLGISATKIPQPMSDINKAMIDAGVSTAKAKNAFEDLHTPITTITHDMDLLIQQAQKSGDWTPVLTAIDEFDKRITNLSKTDLPAAEDQLAKFIQEMINAGAPSEVVQGQIEKLQAIVQKMATEGLPQSAKGWSDLANAMKQVPPAMKDIQQAAEQQIQTDQKSLDLMKQRGDAIGYILDEQGKLLQEEITYAEKTGEDANDLVLGLEKVRLKQEELRLSTHGVADEYVAMINDVLKGFDQMAGAMADAIVNGKNVGAALVGEFKKIGQSILTDLIQAAMVPLKTALIEMIGGLLPGMSGALGVVGGSLSGMNAAAGTASTGLHALASAAQEAAASISAGVGNPASADKQGSGIAGAMSNLASTLNVITGIISAGAEVASTILLSHISSDTGHIEVNTRETFAQITNIWETIKANNVFMGTRTGEILDRLNHIMDSTAQIAAAGVTGGGGIPAATLNKLTDDGALTVKILANTYDLAQGILSAAQTTATDISWVMQDADKIFDETGMIYTMLNNIYDVLLYGKSFGQSSASAAASQRAVQTMSLNSLVAQSITGNNIGRQTADNTGETASDAAALYGPLQAQADAAAAALRHAGNTEAQLAALRQEYAAYEALSNAAHMQGDEMLAQSYQITANNLQNQIAAISHTNTAALISSGQITQQVIEDAAKGIQFSANNGFNDAVGVIKDGDSIIARNVLTGAAYVATSVTSAVTGANAVAAQFNAMMAQTLVNIKGPNSSAGPLPSQQITLNSQGAPAAPSTRGPDNGLAPLPMTGRMGYASGSTAFDQTTDITVHQGEVVTSAAQVAASAAQMNAQAQQIADLQNQLAGLQQGLVGALANSNVGDAQEAQKEINAVQAKLDALPAAMQANTTATQADSGTGGSATDPAAIQQQIAAMMHEQLAAQNELAVAQKTGNAAVVQVAQDKLTSIMQQLAGLQKQQDEAIAIQNHAAAASASGADSSSGADSGVTSLDSSDGIAVLHADLQAILSAIGGGSSFSPTSGSLDDQNQQISDMLSSLGSSSNSSSDAASSDSTSTDTANKELSMQVSLLQKQISSSQANIAAQTAAGAPQEAIDSLQKSVLEQTQQLNQMQQKLAASASSDTTGALGSVDQNGLFVPPSPDAYKAASLANEALNTTGTADLNNSLQFDGATAPVGDLTSLIDAIDKGTSTIHADLTALSASMVRAGVASAPQKWGVPTPKSFDVGGFVGEDQMAMVHKGENVLSPADSSNLLGILRNFNPGMMSAADIIGPTPSVRAASGMQGGGNVTFGDIHVNGVDKPTREIARDIMVELKKLSPKFAAFSQ